MATMAISVLVRPHAALSSAARLAVGTPAPGPQHVMFVAGLVALCVSVLLLGTSLVLRGRFRPGWPAAVAAPEARAAIWLALTGWFPFLALVSYYRAKATFPPTEHWLNFGFTDKRWETAAFLLGALAPMIFLMAAAAIVRVAIRYDLLAWRRRVPLRLARRLPAASPERLRAGPAWAAGAGKWAAPSRPARRILLRAARPARIVIPAALVGAARGLASRLRLAGAIVAPVRAVRWLWRSVPRLGGRVIRWPRWRRWLTRLPARWLTWPPLRVVRSARLRRVLVSLRVPAGIATALALAWYFEGAPWHVDHSTYPISYQEDVFLVGFQAIAKGHLPYIGAAGVQYGPGTQLFSYWIMRHVATFSVVGFRQAWAMLQWAGASVLFVAFFLAFGYVRGLAASLLSALVYPAMHWVDFRPSGQYNGYWAWTNPLRYAGAVALILLLPAVIKRCPGWRGTLGAVSLGASWGLMSYLGQENLAAGAIGALAIGAVVLLSRTFSGRAVGAALAAVLAGFLLVWAPILSFYAAHGDVGRFLQLYFLSPRAVAAGYSNTTWQSCQDIHPGNPSSCLHDPDQFSSPLTAMFYALPFVLAIVGLLAVLEFRPLRVATRWSRQRLMLVAALLPTIMLYQGALLRSDTSHLTGTLIAVPALVIVAGTALPGLLGGRRWRTRIVAGAALIAASFALLPYQSYAWNSVRYAAEQPFLDRQLLSAEPAPSAPATIAAQRVGPGLATAARACCQRAPVSMPAFIAAMDQLHAIVGDRTTYVVDAHDGYPGLVYFVADLTPAPVMYDPYTTILDQTQRAAYLAYFKTTVLPQTQALVTTSLSNTSQPEVQYFLQRYPRARVTTVDIGHLVYYYVLLAPGSG